MRKSDAFSLLTYATYLISSRLRDDELACLFVF